MKILPIVVGLGAFYGLLHGQEPASIGTGSPSLLQLPQPTEFQGLKVGGLSAITFDKSRNRYLALSDNKGKEGSLVFLLRIQEKSAALSQVEITGALRLVGREGEAIGAWDGEGLALSSRNRLYVSFEGTRTVPPGIAVFHAKSGRLIRHLPVPEKFLPRFAEGKQQSGIVKNRGFESLAIPSDSPNLLFCTTEQPLYQDTKGTNPTPIRILRYQLDGKAPPEEKAYFPERDAPYNSVTDIVALDRKRLLVLERAVVTVVRPHHCRIRIYAVDYEEQGVTDISAETALTGRTLRGLSKKLIFDSRDYRKEYARIDNFEGMCLTPANKQGERALLLVADDNFAKDQNTQFLRIPIKEKH